MEWSQQAKTPQAVLAEFRLQAWILWTRISFNGNLVQQ
jgi:hypothetical protein